MKKAVIVSIISVVLILGLTVTEYFKFNDGLLHVVFCDVGQGDAIFITTPRGKHVLIDGGPNRNVLDCLAKHMPFWERTIDLMIVTHPHADHFMGMYYVLDRYIVTSFATERLENKSGEFQGLIKTLQEKSVPVKYVYRGDKWRISADEIASSRAPRNDVVLSVLGPTKELLDRTSPNGNIGDSKEFASLVMELSYDVPSAGSGQAFHMLLTGDTQTGELGDIAQHLDNNIAILQSPHHGSRTGLNQTIVQMIAPKVAMISVGAKNRYGHPNKQTLDLFKQYSIPIFRTDQVGDIEVIIDGNSKFKITSSK